MEIKHDRHRPKVRMKSINFLKLQKLKFLDWATKYLKIWKLFLIFVLFYV